MNEAVFLSLKKTINHPSYAKAVDRLTEAVSMAQQLNGAAIFLSGPTRCGKSQLLSDFKAKMEKHPTDSDDLFAVSDFALGSIPTKPNSKTLIASMLAAIGIQASPSQSAHDLQDRLCLAIRDRGIRVIALDECAHCAERGAHLSKRGATDHFKWLIDQTGVVLILSGLPKFQSLIDENEQLRDRSLSTIELNPYAWGRQIEATQFAEAFSAALCNMQSAGAQFDFDFEDLVFRLYGVSGGRVGMLVRLLQGAVQFMKDDVLTVKEVAKSAALLTQSQLNASYFFGENAPKTIDLVRSYICVMQDAGLEVAPESLLELEALEVA